MRVPMGAGWGEEGRTGFRGLTALFLVTPGVLSPEDASAPTRTAPESSNGRDSPFRPYLIAGGIA